MITLVYIGTSIIGIAYILTLFIVALKWKSTPDYSPVKKAFLSHSEILISVIIPARNEENNIVSCLEAISRQDLNGLNARLEVLLINDHSDDLTVDNARSVGLDHLEIINCPENTIGKKAAIKLALSQIKGDIICMTDADCEPNSLWIKTISSYFLSHPDVDLVGGPVKFKEASVSILKALQDVDIAGMMAITLFGISNNYFVMANGANMAFRRSSIESTPVIWTLDHASGDDMDIITHFSRQNKKIVWLKSLSGMVKTRPVETWSSLFLQRLRWGSKNTSSNQWIMISLLGLSFVLSISTLVLCAFMIAFPFLLPAVLILMTSKVLGDMALTKEIRHFFSIKIPIIWLPLLSIIHAFFIAIVGTASLLTTGFNWKGRYTN